MMDEEEKSETVVRVEKLSEEEIVSDCVSQEDKKNVEENEVDRQLAKEKRIKEILKESYNTKQQWTRLFHEILQETDGEQRLVQSPLVEDESDQSDYEILYGPSDIDWNFVKKKLPPTNIFRDSPHLFLRCQHLNAYEINMSRSVSKMQSIRNTTKKRKRQIIAKSPGSERNTVVESPNKIVEQVKIPKI